MRDMKRLKGQKMTVVVDLQLSDNNLNSPTQIECEKIVQSVMDALKINDSKECTIRVVGREESATLNEQYRNKEGATNVLSFAFESPVDINLQMEIDLLGDLVICAPLVADQASEQNKTIEMHWTHLIVHGILHLLGYDHLNEVDSDVMETLECKIMSNLGYPDPYGMID